MSRPDDSVAGGVRARLDRLDFYQQRHPALGVPIAVARKFFEDESINLAAVIAFWAFFSVFPLPLIFVTLLGYFLSPSLQGDVLRSAASFFPLLSTDSMGRLSGRWWTLVVGILSAVWSGSFVVIAIQSAFNSVWEIPHAQRPSFGAQIKRGLFALGAIALGLVGSTVISSYLTATATGTGLGVVARLAGYLISVALDVGLFIVAFRLLTDRDVSTRDVLPGALLSGIVFWLLQQLSSLIIVRYLHNAERIYGSYATVITMLTWFYSQSVVTLVGAQLNVVLKERLHPRRLIPAPPPPPKPIIEPTTPTPRNAPTTTTNESTPRSSSMTPTRNKATPELGAHGAILVTFAHARRWSPGTVPADRPAGTPWTIGADLLVADLESA